MFRKPTVLIVGAGASHDLDFPLGDGLKYKISSTPKQVKVDRGQLSGPDDLIDAIRSHARETGTELNQYLNAARTIASHVMYARSIDEFIDHHQDDLSLVFLAKATICKVILPCEKSSNLFKKNNSNDPPQVDHKMLDERDAWLKQMWYMMRQDVPRERPVQLFENFSIINFNYDRTLEAFLYKALGDMHDMSSYDARKYISNAPIFHPYGLVDDISSEGIATPFGGSVNVDLKRLSANIRTYCESEGSEQKLRYQEILKSAKNIIFLGFAYRALNMELLKFVASGSLNVYGTAFKIPEENYEGIEGRLGGIFSRLGLGPINRIPSTIGL